ncbi:tetratricopeptide repeat protein [Rhodohalobacter sp. 614A]|uniref:tetratricopeptide repeat protein n=1 Tax=Rhodohalobacter sp. 614A TaxID=2908649 RepID=UPI001F1C137A|nr:tetratricopeptide repeat protein [Rhodohalobacter sp. 614A]
MTRKSLQLLLVFLLLFPAVMKAQDSITIDDEQAQALEYYIQGINDFENQDYELALDKLTAAHLKLSDHAGVNYALSDVYLETGDYTNAAYYGQIAADLEPENKWYHLHLARVYDQSGRNEQAVNSLKKILEYHPNDIDVLYRLATNYTDIGELEKSNEMLDQILELRGNTFEIHLAKFQNYNALNQTENALEELHNMRELHPGNLSTLHTISQFYLELDREEEAKEVLFEARNRNPNDTNTLILLAEIFINNNEWEELGDTFVMMMKNPMINPPQKMELVRFMMVKYQNEPEQDVLEQQVQKVIETLGEEEPDYAPAQLVSADYYLQQNDMENALINLERATEINPEQAEAWAQRIQILFSLGRYGEVINLSQEANEHAPDNAFIQFFTGTSFMFEGQHEQAETWLENATMAPSRREFRSAIYGTLGDVKQQLDKWQETVDAYERALRLDSENYTAMNNYAYYLSVREENLEKALELATKAVGSDPQNPSFLDTLGWVYFQMENYSQAQNYIQQSIDSGDASAEVFEHMGDVHEALGNDEQAREWWQKALEDDPGRTHLNEKLEQI